jgi:hypothetical protein
MLAVAAASPTPVAAAAAATGVSFHHPVTIGLSYG